MPGTSGAEAAFPDSPWVLGGSCALCYLCVLLGISTPTAAPNNHKLQSTEKETGLQLKLILKSKCIQPQTNSVPISQICSRPHCTKHQVPPLASVPNLQARTSWPSLAVNATQHICKRQRTICNGKTMGTPARFVQDPSEPALPTKLKRKLNGEKLHFRANQN